MPTIKGKQVPRKTAGKAQGRNQRATIPAGRKMQPVAHPNESEGFSGREYVTDVGALTTFGLTGYRVNPRNVGLFPRLSAIASRYEKYEFKKLHFIYRSSAVTTDPGTTYMYADPDSYDAQATTKLEVLNHRNSARGKVYEDVRLAVDPKDLKGVRFCENTLIESGDYRITDVAKFYIGATTGSAKQVGELEVEYDVILYSPTIDSADLLSAPFAAYNADNFNLLPISGGTDSTRLSTAQGLFTVGSMDSDSNYFVANPALAEDPGDGNFSVKGPAEMDILLVLEGTGITTPPVIQEAGGQAGQKVTLTKVEEAIQSTTKVIQLWRLVSNNPTSVVSYFHLGALVCTTITKLYAIINALHWNTALPPVARAIRRRKALSARSFNTFGLPLSDVVASSEPVAKSHGGTCVMLPDLNAPKVSVPTPSPNRKFVLACHRCGSFDDCSCPCTKLQQKTYSCDNCRHPTCLGQCS